VIYLSALLGRTGYEGYLTLSDMGSDCRIFVGNHDEMEYMAHETYHRQLH
jgi:hypothetical protein